MHKETQVEFTDQVAIVTGAGGGLGRAFAFELARRGAAVLVNDYGGDTQGRPGTSDRAESVAAELRAAGYRAVADGVEVGTADAARKIIANALASFGRVDVLINNAGVALPGLITQHPDEDVERVFRINLLGPYALVRAAWPVMVEQHYGRILNISSNAALGLGANAPYATSKAGMLGLTFDAAQEGRTHGILVNALMPVAHTRLTDQIPDATFVEWFRKHMPAAKVAASVSYFLSRESDVTGRMFSAGGGRLACVAVAENPGVVDAVDAEHVRRRVADVLDVHECTVVRDGAAELGLYSAEFPWQGDGEGPSLSEASIVKSYRES